MQRFFALFCICLLVNSACSETTFRQMRSAGSQPKSSGNQNNTPATTQSSSDRQKALSSVQQNSQYAQMRQSVLTATQEGNLFIRDQNGKPASVEQYESSPDTHFLLFANKDKFLGLQTSVAPVFGKNKLPSGIKISAKLYNVDDLDSVSSNELGTPLVDDAAILSLKADEAANKKAMKNLITALKQSADLAMNDRGMLEQFSDFLFPSAYADNDTIFILAIVFSAVAGLTGLIGIKHHAWLIAAALSAITAIVLWIIYFVNENEDDDQQSQNQGSGAESTQNFYSCSGIKLYEVFKPDTIVCAQIESTASDNIGDFEEDCQEQNGTYAAHQKCTTEKTVGTCLIKDSSRDMPVLFYEPATPEQGKYVCGLLLMGLWTPAP